MDYDNNLKQIYKDIMNDEANLEFTSKGWLPLYSVSSKAKILIIGQAPGINAQNTNIAWNDKSGDKLREWLGVTKNQFFDPNIFGLVPMDFYFPGKGKTGDLPPRIGFAEKWHPKIIENLVDLRLIVLIGNYSQMFYLKKNYLKTLTETVRNYKAYLPEYFPLPHPSPLNFRWFNKNSWFESEVLIDFKLLISKILKT